ncbi:MAG: C40 family peptidase [Eubacterium sp.]|nr:C40 family peptidase [Eubacterium sp.]
MKFDRKYVKYIAAGVLAVGIIAVPVSAAMVATDQPLSGAAVVVDEYCNQVANGAVTSAAVSVTPEPAAEESQPTAAPEETQKSDEHVKLNLNYSRLGVATKVDTYLNVRKKPSENSKIVGKMTKNAGCHIYKIKKGWAKMVSGNVTGWVKAKYLVTDEKAEKAATKVGRECVEIKTNSLRVRALPTTDAPIYSVVSEGEEFVIRENNLTTEFVEKVIKKQKISKEAIKRAGGMDAINADLANWVCVTVDDDYAFVAKEFVEEQYSLKRAVKVGTVSASSSDGVSEGQASIVEYAKQFLGNRYVWGGASLTHGTDCSGFTMSLYAKYGHSLPHNAAAQAGVTRKVSSPKPGDLFFYSNGSRINHVAMYIGSGLVIHASNPSDGIKISNAYYRHPVKIGRVMN